MITVSRKLLSPYCGCFHLSSKCLCVFTFYVVLAIQTKNMVCMCVCVCGGCVGVCMYLYVRINC